MNAPAGTRLVRMKPKTPLGPCVDDRAHARVHAACRRARRGGADGCERGNPAGVPRGAGDGRRATRRPSMKQRGRAIRRCRAGLHVEAEDARS